MNSTRNQVISLRLVREAGQAGSLYESLVVCVRTGLGEVSCFVEILQKIQVAKCAYRRQGAYPQRQE